LTALTACLIYSSLCKSSKRKPQIVGTPQHSIGRRRLEVFSQRLLENFSGIVPHHTRSWPAHLCGSRCR